MHFSRESANALRFLSIDAVEKARSGHPGMPLGMADIATVLWQQFLKHNPANPLWCNRDRFVLSNGHGSMLLYALLHLSGYALSIDDLKQFRQLHSKTPGHPEFGETPGVETTTGPLGQGLANATGMAIAEKILASQFNKPGFPLVDHHTYAFVGDGCLMEGISHEVCSLAGTLGLGKLIVFYDDNGISIDGEVHSWFSDDTAMRFRACNWQVIEQVDGHDPESITRAIEAARADTSHPSLIICKTVIGYGSMLAGSEKSHGAPLGEKGVQAVREALNWPHAPFDIPESIRAAWNFTEAGTRLEDEWLALLEAYRTQFPAEHAVFLRRVNGDLPDNWKEESKRFIESALQNTSPVATRKASQECLEAFGPLLPELLGGSADLTGSNNTDWSGSHAITREDFSGNYLHYGVREFGMSAIMNGIALHGGFIPYGGTFLVFADYARNAIRLSALMGIRVIYVLSHDSVGLGEDGPTHQPIEHAAMLRMTPNVEVWRPADRLETRVAWQQAISHIKGPSCLLLSRQNLPALPAHAGSIADIARGAHIVHDCQGMPDILLLATGSEVQIALAVALRLSAQGVQVRVVSMPCCERFLAADITWRESILPQSVRRRAAIEAGVSAFWYAFAGLDGIVIGIDRFGVSAPAEQAFEYLGLTPEKVFDAICQKYPELAR
ncbi:transketolase [Legionella geestiana]|uniref:transketolase n=1 Tax=Legionella geestiana TaxID=45065 RepID=UPI00109198B5|nr:transketolase [Legionella geestiana]QDQ39823.1 transketolase [Legionella geestiana]